MMIKLDRFLNPIMMDVNTINMNGPTSLIRANFEGHCDGIREFQKGHDKLDANGMDEYDSRPLYTQVTRATAMWFVSC